MAAETKIAWADSTFNPWIGCTKVTAECDHCYAETWANRFGQVAWGNGEPRRRTSAQNWHQPIKWNRMAAEAGVTRTVFCASLSDWADTEVPPEWRHDLFDLIDATPNLDWLLLTKRHARARMLLPGTPRPNIRVGMTVGNESSARMRLPYLCTLGLSGWRTFISYEPALERVDWWPWLDPEGISGGCIQWLICGGESGPGARPFDMAWARETRDSCRRAGVPFFMKQMGACAFDEKNGIAGAQMKVPAEAATIIARRLKDKAGADPSEWPADLRVQEFPETSDKRGDE